MASEFYVAEDGSIHRHPVTVINNHGNRTNTYALAPAAAYAQTRTEYRPIHQVSEGRIVWFWIISIIMALLIAVGVTQGFGAEFYGSDGGFIATIGPFRKVTNMNLEEFKKKMEEDGIDLVSDAEAKVIVGMIDSDKQVEKLIAYSKLCRINPLDIQNACKILEVDGKDIYGLSFKDLQKRVVSNKEYVIFVLQYLESREENTEVKEIYFSQDENIAFWECGLFLKAGKKNGTTIVGVKACIDGVMRTDHIMVTVNNGKFVSIMFEKH